MRRGTCRVHPDPAGRVVAWVRWWRSRGDVVGEPARCNEAWQEGVDVVVVGFGPAQFLGERAESVGVDHGICLVCGEATDGDEGSPAVVLGCGSDGLIFGSELGDRAPPVLLGGDGLVRRQLSTAVLEHAVEDSAGGGVGLSPGCGVA